MRVVKMQLRFDWMRKKEENLHGQAGIDKRSPRAAMPVALNQLELSLIRLGSGEKPVDGREILAQRGLCEQSVLLQQRNFAAAAVRRGQGFQIDGLLLVCGIDVQLGGRVVTVVAVQVQILETARRH